MVFVTARRYHDGMISKAEKGDLPGILALQLRAFGRVAQHLNADTLPPLQQTIEDLLEESADTVFLKYTVNGHITGSVRGQLDAEGVCHVGKLIVDPACQNCGIGRALMTAIEEHFRNQAVRYVLFTSDHTPNTLHLYRSLGYRELHRKDMNGLTMIFMEKQ